jgi:hypothetical protein
MLDKTGEGLPIVNGRVFDVPSELVTETVLAVVGAVTSTETVAVTWVAVDDSPL